MQKTMSSAYKNCNPLPNTTRVNYYNTIYLIRICRTLYFKLEIALMKQNFSSTVCKHIWTLYIYINFMR